MTHQPDEEEDTVDVDFEVDFTHLRPEPVPLVTTPGPGHPPTILARSEPLLSIRYGRNPD